MDQTVWQRAEVCDKLSQWLRGHLLILHVPFIQNGEMCHETFSGFDLDVGHARFWITAGHVIDVLRRMLEGDPRVKIGTPVWLDNHSNPIAAGLPMSLAGRLMYSSLPSADWGCISLTLLECANFDGHSGHRCLTPDVWRNPEHQVADAHYVCGAPRSLAEFQQISSHNGKVVGRTFVGTPCIPLHPLSEEDARNQFGGWASEPSRFFQVLPLTTQSTAIELGTTQGMSGSPVFSLSTQDGQCRYRLTGVQAAQSPDASLIRAVQIEHLVETLQSAWPQLPAVG